MNPVIRVRTPIATDNPWMMKYEIYTFDALGSLLANISGASVGDSRSCFVTAVAADDIVVTRNSWMT